MADQYGRPVADPAFGLRHDRVELGEHVGAVSRAPGHLHGFGSNSPGEHRVAVDIYRRVGSGAFQRAGRDLAYAGPYEHLNPVVGRYRRGCLLGADEGRSHDRFNLLAGQRVNQSERLLLTDLAEPRTRNIGIEQVEHVRRCLSVTDEEQSHACEYGRPATILQPAAGGRSRIIWLESQLDPPKRRERLTDRRIGERIVVPVGQRVEPRPLSSS